MKERTSFWTAAIYSDIVGGWVLIALFARLPAAYARAALQTPTPTPIPSSSSLELSLNPDLYTESHPKVETNFLPDLMISSMGMNQAGKQECTVGLLESQLNKEKFDVGTKNGG